MPVASFTATGCTTSTAPATTTLLATGTSPGPGSTMLVLGSGADAVLVLNGLSVSSTGVAFIQFVPLASPASAKAATVLGQQAAALGQLGAGGETFLALGFPTATVDGVAAGAVGLYQVDTSTTEMPTAADETLFCAHPTTGQVFGRALAILPYNGTTILSVAANNEVFTYFRTQQYADTRQQ
jgi:hypothetical protein